MKAHCIANIYRIAGGRFLANGSNNATSSQHELRKNEMFNESLPLIVHFSANHRISFYSNAFEFESVFRHDLRTESVSKRSDVTFIDKPPGIRVHSQQVDWMGTIASASHIEKLTMHTCDLDSKQLPRKLLLSDLSSHVPIKVSINIRARLAEVSRAQVIDENHSSSLTDVSQWAL